MIAVVLLSIAQASGLIQSERRQPAGGGACSCPCSGGTAAHPFRRPEADAFALNREGRGLYRARLWAAARAKYQAALAADPAFLAPRLNLACAYAQEERFEEAVTEAVRLAESAFVPWAQEIRDAADLAPLHARPERQTLEGALADAGRRWGAPLGRALLFVARRGPPVRLPAPDIPGVFHLGLEQEVLAWLPDTGAYRQVTAEDGRVLGFVQAAEGSAIDYVRAGRLVQTPGQRPTLRALSLRRLHLATMTVGPVVPIGADVLALQVDPARDGRARVVLATEGGPSTAQIFDGRSLSREEAGVAPASLPPDGMALHLNGEGVTGPPGAERREPCAFSVEQTAKSGSGPALRIRHHGRKPFWLDAPFAAGLQGLPFR